MPKIVIRQVAGRFEQALPEAKRDLTIGHGSQADIRVPQSAGSRPVHARISFFTEGRNRIASIAPESGPLYYRNGPSVGFERMDAAPLAGDGISAIEEKDLHHGAQFKVGENVFEVFDPEVEKARPELVRQLLSAKNEFGDLNLDALEDAFRSASREPVGKLRSIWQAHPRLTISLNPNPETPLGLTGSVKGTLLDLIRKVGRSPYEFFFTFVEKDGAILKAFAAEKVKPGFVSSVDMVPAVKAARALAIQVGGRYGLGHTHPDSYGPVFSNFTLPEKNEPYGTDYETVFAYARYGELGRNDHFASKYSLVACQDPLTGRPTLGVWEVRPDGEIASVPWKEADSARVQPPFPAAQAQQSPGIWLPSGSQPMQSGRIEPSASISSGPVLWRLQVQPPSSKPSGSEGKGGGRAGKDAPVEPEMTPAERMVQDRVRRAVSRLYEPLEGQPPQNAGAQQASGYWAQEVDRLGKLQPKERKKPWWRFWER